MRTNAVAACFTVLLVCMSTSAAEFGRETKHRVLERLRLIYEQQGFRARGFDAQWLPDSSGYVVAELAPGASDPVLVRYDAASGTRTALAPSAENRPHGDHDTSPDGNFRLLAEHGNLLVADQSTGQKVELVQNSDQQAVTFDKVAWNPNGKRVAFVQSDASNVRLRSSILPGDPTYPQVNEVRYARVGGAIPDLKVGVANVEGATQWLEISKPGEEFYLGQVSWAGSDEVLIEKLSRFRNERWFIIANTRTGATKGIFHESDPAWVVASYAKNAGLHWIQDGRAFIVLSEKDGWRHAFVYSRDGEQQALLTPGDFDIIETARVDEVGGWFYYYASPNNATQQYLYRVRLDGKGEPERVTPDDEPGTHEYEFSPDAKWAFHSYSTFDNPPVIELVRLPSHDVVRVLEDNQALRTKMKPLITQPTEFVQIEIEGGVSMDAWIIKPKDFDPARKYPVLVYVYGEPHAQTVLDAWGKVHADYHRLIADLGYLVVSIDNRGTPAPKGAAWRRAVFGSLGPLSTEEQAAGLKELARQRPYVDLSRVAVWGWSGGGSNTLNAMFRKPDVFHVGIAVAPKPQPHLYNAWFQEIYMETPETNPDGYKRAAPINFADGLVGDLLIVHGTGETNTHLQITEGLVDRLIELGKQFDYMAYPNRDHGLREGRGTEVHLRMLMVRYLVEHLEPGPN